MSVERELLWRIQQVLQCERDDYGFVGEIENLLAQPEQEPFMFKDRELTGSLIAHDDMYKKGYERGFSIARLNHELSCENKIDGSCPLHNLRCNYPECEE
jgi:hypothetical protein